MIHEFCQEKAPDCSLLLGRDIKSEEPEFVKTCVTLLYYAPDLNQDKITGKWKAYLLK